MVGRLLIVCPPVLYDIVLLLRIVRGFYIPDRIQGHPFVLLLLWD